MKLALAIAVCVYLCAVIAVGQGASDVDELEFQRILAFVNGDPKYKDFPQTVTDNRLYKDFLRDKNIRFWDLCKLRYNVMVDNYETFKRKMYYNIMRDNYETFKRCQRVENYRDREKIEANYELYKTFLDDVNDKYTKFLESAEDPKSTANKYNLLEQSFEELNKADLNFKLQCILASRTAGDSSSSTRTTCCWTSNIAYDILEEQLGIFIKDLMDSVLDKSVKAKLEKISKKQDFLGFFGLWFATDWNKDDMKTKIRNMKKKHRLGRYNDKAAKIMVSLEMFDEEVEKTSNIQKGKYEGQK